MATTAAQLRPRRPFPPWHRADRIAVLVCIGLIWLGILMGFVPDIYRRYRANVPYPLVTHLHAALFVGWLALLTTQALLVRGGRLALHKRLGIAGMVMAPLMVIVGCVTAYIVDQSKIGTPRADPAFIVVQFGDMLMFAGIIAPAFLFRREPAVHKRLILLATVLISDAGYARWLFPHLLFLGNGYWANYAQSYLGSMAVAATMAGYDLVTRRRLHPVFAAALAYGVAVSLIANYLYVLPATKPVALRLLGF